MKSEKYVKALEMTTKNIQKITESQEMVANTISMMANNEENVMGAVECLFKTIKEIFELLENTNERVSDIYQMLYEMFPDSEIIETMGADDQETRMKLYKSYLNLNGDWESRM